MCVTLGEVFVYGMYIVKGISEAFRGAADDGD